MCDSTFIIYILHIFSSSVANDTAAVDAVGCCLTEVKVFFH